MKQDKEEDFTVECNVCRQQYDNWTGSIPCCGSIAYLVAKDGSTSKKVSLYTSVGVAMLYFGKKE